MGETSPTPWRVEADTRCEVDSWSREERHILSGWDIIGADDVAVVGCEGILGDGNANAALICRAVNAHVEMVEALKIAQSTLAMLTEPKTIQSTNVREAWGMVVEAEMKCRSALAKATGGER